MLLMIGSKAFRLSKSNENTGKLFLIIGVYQAKKKMLEFSLPLPTSTSLAMKKYQAYCIEKGKADVFLTKIENLAMRFLIMF